MIAFALAILAALPFAFVSLPPLADAPGHLGQFAVQAAGPASPLRSYFAFQWGLQLNLACDLLIEGLRHILSLGIAFRLIVAAIPVLAVCGVVAMALKVNPGRAAAASWALPFAYSFPFLYGFLNFSLAAALSFLAYALWERLDRRRLQREACFWLITPALMIGHAIGGGLLPAMIGAAAIGGNFPSRASLRDPAAYRAFFREVRPMLAVVPIIILWRLGQSGGAASGDTTFILSEKLNAVAQALRDQYHWFDIASMVGVVAIWLAGFWWGARLSRRHAFLVSALALLFLLTPSELAGAYFSDMRLVPPLMIAALTLQNWSRVSPAIARAVMIAGLLLTVVRMAIVSTSFAAYQRSFTEEEAALPHIAVGSRVIALVTRQCKASRAWRMDRLDHLPAMATVERASWVNAHWDVGDIHLLRVTFRPSDDFYDDPSQNVWQPPCLHGDPPRTDEERRNVHRTIAQVLPQLPLGAVDYLWLLHASLPPGPWQARLRPVWSNGTSSLYRVAPPAPR